MSPHLPHTAQETSNIVGEFATTIEQVQDFEFRVRFDKEQFKDLEMDEPAPLGHDRGPNAARVLSAAIGNCLSASLLFCARKSRVQTGPIRTVVRTRLARNEQGRLRIAEVEVEIDPAIPEIEKKRAMHCLEIFEDYCVVTQSVRQGINVRVAVKA